MPQTRVGAINPNLSELHRAVAREPGMFEITCRCRDATCSDSVLVRLPGGKTGCYHPDFRSDSGPRYVEVKQGSGYNLDTLFRMAGAAKEWGEDYVVRCDKVFHQAWIRYASEVPRLQGARLRFITHEE